MFRVYILKNKDGKLYIGQTSNLQSRLEYHNKNLVKSTKNYGPWELVFERPFQTRGEALKYERYLKNQKGGNGLKKIISETPSAPR